MTLARTHTIRQTARAAGTSAGYRQERLKGAILLTGSVKAEGKTGPVEVQVIETLARAGRKTGPVGGRARS